jgi:hypothetical protein
MNARVDAVLRMLTVRCDRVLFDRARRVACARGVTMSDFVREAIKVALGEP